MILLQLHRPYLKDTKNNLLPSSLNECSTIMIDDNNTDPDIAEPCGGLQCIDGLHCCNLAVGCQQCCSKHHCKRWEKCLYVHFYIKQNL